MMGLGFREGFILHCSTMLKIALLQNRLASANLLLTGTRTHLQASTTQTPYLRHHFLCCHQLTQRWNGSFADRLSSRQKDTRLPRLKPHVLQADLGLEPLSASHQKTYLQEASGQGHNPRTSMSNRSIHKERRLLWDVGRFYSTKLFSTPILPLTFCVDGLPSGASYLEPCALFMAVRTIAYNRAPPAPVAPHA